MSDHELINLISHLDDQSELADNSDDSVIDLEEDEDTGDE